MTAVTVVTYTHSVTYVSDNILRGFKDIVSLIGLDPKGLVANWKVLMRGLETWLDTGHLNKVVLEIFNPSTGNLVGRWDIDIVYGWSGDGEFWVDPDQVRYHIQKVKLAPSNVTYRVVVENRENHPSVKGWDSTSFLITDGFVQQSLGLTVNHSGLGGSFCHWRTNNINNQYSERATVFDSSKTKVAMLVINPKGDLD